MLELKTKEKLAEAARTLAGSYEIVHHNSNLFLPIDYETETSEPLPPTSRRVWKLLSRKDLQRFASSRLGILFSNESEVLSFEGMVKQLAEYSYRNPTSVLIKTPGGLKELTEDGVLLEPAGMFIPNCLPPTLNEDEEDKEYVRSVLLEWLSDEAEVESLLYHLATALAPGWSAVKYILLLGEGRNGKSVLLYMLTYLFGRENVSSVTRQEMAEKSPVCSEINSCLLNIVMDGAMSYVKDSGMEKTLIAGETGYVRRLYESSLTPVQTNGLFLEGLNREPKTRDKSSALQKRLVRFHFPNTFPLNPKFAAKMTQEKYLGALLALLLDHYVLQTDVFDKLSPTGGAMDLQASQMILNNPVLQWLQHEIDDDPHFSSKLVGKDVMTLVTSFLPWAESQDKGNYYAEADAAQMMKEAFNVVRSTRRSKPPKNYWKVVGFKPDTQLVFDYLERTSDVDDGTPVVVDDGQV